MIVILWWSCHAGNQLSAPANLPEIGSNPLSYVFHWKHGGSLTGSFLEFLVPYSHACGRLCRPSIIAPYLAAFAPGINAIRLLFIGLGWMNDDAVVRSMTRNGDRR